MLFRISRIFFQRCNKWPEPTLRWTAVAREGRRCRRACHTQPVREDPVKIGHSAGEQHQVKCCQVCADARSAVTFADCCSLHLPSRARCIFQPRTHHVGSQHGRSRLGCRRPDGAAADEATHRHDRPRWLSGHFHWLQVKFRAQQPLPPPCPAHLSHVSKPYTKRAHPHDRLLAQEVARSSSPSALGVAARGASEARQAERTGALGGFRWTACLACAMPVQVSGWERRGGWQETRSSLCTGVCYSIEKVPVTHAVRAHSRADFGLLYLLPRARTQTAVSRVLISYPLTMSMRTGGRLRPSGTA